MIGEAAVDAAAAADAIVSAPTVPRDHEIAPRTADEVVAALSTVEPVAAGPQTIALLQEHWQASAYRSDDELVSSGIRRGERRSTPRSFRASTSAPHSGTLASRSRSARGTTSAIRR